ncbi:hypothetical protein [Andreprevotia lacus]|nr:hypothetical protein [Andreprevotia lacus]
MKRVYKLYWVVCAVFGALIVLALLGSVYGYTPYALPLVIYLSALGAGALAAVGMLLVIIQQVERRAAREAPPQYIPPPRNAREAPPRR